MKKFVQLTHIAELDSQEKEISKTYNTSVMHLISLVQYTEKTRYLVEHIIN